MLRSLWSTDSSCHSRKQTLENCLSKRAAHITAACDGQEGEDNYGDAYAEEKMHASALLDLHGKAIHDAPWGLDAAGTSASNDAAPPVVLALGY